MGARKSKRDTKASTHLGRRWLRGALEVGVVLLIFVLVSAWQTRKLLPDDGRPAPAFQLVDLAGRSVRLADYQGKTTLLHFWATWCGVCRQEFSALNAVHSGLDDDQAVLTIVADSEDPERVRRFVRERGLAYPVLLATADVLKSYRVKAFPTNYYIDKDGRLRETTVGLSTRFSMQARMGCAK